MLSFNERLMDEQDALITDQAALEEDYFSTVEHMRMLTNNIAGVASKLKRERNVLEKDMKVLQEQFNEQSEKLNMIQEKLASYTPRNVNKRQKRAESNITNLKTKKEKNTLPGQLIDQAKELNESNQKFEQAENEVVVQLKHQKTGLQKKLWLVQNSKGRQAKELDLLKEHNAAMILKLESSAEGLKEKNKELQQLTCLLEDKTITTFENGKINM